MATVPTLPLMSADEYLNSNWRPDMEFVDGVLVERSVPTIPQSILQMLLIQLFASWQQKLRFLPLPEVRTQIIKGARYRVPDVILCPTPLPKGKIVTTVPWAVIEILSPDDRFSEQAERFRDYSHIGVEFVILLDPERMIAYRCENGSLIQRMFRTLSLPTGDLPFDTDALFQALTDKLGDQDDSIS